MWGEEKNLDYSLLLINSKISTLEGEMKMVFRNVPFIDRDCNGSAEII